MLLSVMAKLVPRRELVIQASAKIARLRETIAKANQELRECETELDDLLEGRTQSDMAVGAPAPPSTAGAISAISQMLDLEEKSLNQRVIDLLVVGNFKDFSAEDVANELGYTNLPSVRSALARLADEKRIVRTARGRYQSHAREAIPEAS
jgi:hypothetical protein